MFLQRVMIALWMNRPKASIPLKLGNEPTNKGTKESDVGSTKSALIPHLPDQYVIINRMNPTDNDPINHNITVIINGNEAIKCNAGLPRQLNFVKKVTDRMQMMGKRMSK